MGLKKSDRIQQIVSRREYLIYYLLDKRYNAAHVLTNVLKKLITRVFYLGEVICPGQSIIQAL